MSLVMHYPSVPNLLINWFPTVVEELSVRMDGTAISTDLPNGYKDACPFIRVTRIGGPRELGLDYAQVRLEVFALSYDDAETVANELSTLIEWNLHSYNDGQGSVLTAETTIAPAYAPWDDQPVTRFISTHHLVVGALT